MLNRDKNLDILQELDLKEEIQKLQLENTTDSKDIKLENSDIKAQENIKEEIKKIEENTKDLKSEKKSPIFKAFSAIFFLTKYMLTSALIFAVLLVTTNYSAYINIAKSYLYAGDLKVAEQRLVSSVEASNIKNKYTPEAEKEKQEEKEEEIEELKNNSKISIKNMKRKQDQKDINLDIEITPYSNRVIIPKIGKNIPLVDIKNRNINGENELNDIFMKELEKGIIRYPGSAKPGENGSSFIFGHSSNFPWIKGDYNDVFALLDKVSYGDEIIVYYGQEKFKYKIKEKRVITPGDVSVLNRNKDKSEVTLMTCWPIGTTLNRLIVTGEIVKE